MVADDSPSPLWKFVTDHQLVFGAEVLTKLDEIDLKIFYDLCRASREVVIRSKIELNNEKRFVEDVKSKREAALAWDNYRFGERDRIGRKFTQERFCYRVAEAKNLDYLKWAREVKRCAWDQDTIISAASQGNLDMVKYCVENGCPMDAEACSCSAFEGHLDVLKYLHEHGCPWDSDTCRWARAQDHFDCLIYAIQNQCPGFEQQCAWDEDTIISAASQGNLDMVKYCVENGCPMDAEACSCSAFEGHLDVLKYLHEHDCPWDSDTCYYAHENNHIDCLNYAIQNQCPGFERFDPEHPHYDPPVYSDEGEEEGEDVWT
jgi:hypothetical protein